MLTVRYGFDTDLKRSGHASCWCPPLGAIVQFGGWPPSAQLSRVIHEEGSDCPLYVMPLGRILAAMRKADQRRPQRVWDTCMEPARVCRMARLSAALTSKDGSAIIDGAHDTTTCPCCSRGARWLTRSTAPQEQGLHESDEDEGDDSEDGRRQFVYAAGYHSESYSSSSTASGTGSSYSLSSTPPSQPAPRSMGASSPPLQSGDPTNGADLTVPTAAHRRTHSSVNTSADASDASYAPPALTRALLQQLDQHDTENARLRARLEEIAMNMASTTTNTPTGEVESPWVNRQDPGAVAFTPAEPTHQRTMMDTRTETSSVPTHAHTHHSRSTAFVLHERARHEAPAILQDAEAIPGKHTLAPLRWRTLRPSVAPRSRHGHVLVYCARQLFLLSGSYWAHGNALASTDMTYDVSRRSWSQTNSLLPPRFCAAVAVSNARPPPSTPPEPATPPMSDAQWSMDPDAIVVYAFGGLNYSRTLTNTLHRLWLPDGALEELPQYGAQPRNQFKGVLVCDVQQERSPAERRAGLSTVGRLFYMDGFQEGHAMAPALRSYNLANGVWTRLCPSPDLTRSQLSLAQYTRYTGPRPTSPEGHGASVEVTYAATCLARFDVLGGMPTRRGRQLRSRTMYSYDPAWQCYDFDFALPVPGLTAHTITLMPPPPPASPVATVVCDAEPTVPVREEAMPGGCTTTATAATRFPRSRSIFHALVKQAGTRVGCTDRDSTEEAAVRAAHSSPPTPEQVVRQLRELVDGRQVTALCVGGNEDQQGGDQNNLGEPVGWLYCLGPRAVSLSEYTRVSLDKQRVPYRTLLLQGEQKDELLDELF